MVAWNNRGNLSTISTQKTGGSTYLSLAYAYFANAQIQQITNSLNGNKSEKYTYDELGRLLTAQLGPDSGMVRKYQYDYDRYGNRWGQNVIAGSGYNGQASFDQTSNRVNSSGFGFDGSGNLTANGSGTSYTYNQENFLSAATTTLGSAAYVNHAQGRRVRKTVSGTVTDYFYSGSELVAEKTGSAWTDHIFFGDQRLVQQNGTTAATAVYLHTDHLGSTRVCTDGNGNSNGTCDYEPFGETQVGTTCSVPTNFRFAGMQWDSESGLFHTWFRQYDPTQGRWMSVDPLPGDEARYTYSSNDPVNATDPAGLSVQFIKGQTWSCSRDGIAADCSSLYERMVDEFDLVLQTFSFQFWGNWCPDKLGDCGPGWHFGTFDLVNLSILDLLQLRKPQQEKKETRCVGPALISKGNENHVGTTGAFPGRKIRRNSAVVAPEQFGLSTGADMRSFGEKIHGYVQYKPLTGKVRTFSFSGVRDVINDKSKPNFRAGQLKTAAKEGGRFLIELPGLPLRQFKGEGNIIIFVPAGTPCPQGTEPR